MTSTTTIPPEVLVIADHELRHAATTALAIQHFFPKQYNSAKAHLHIDAIHGEFALESDLSPSQTDKVLAYGAVAPVTAEADWQEQLWQGAKSLANHKAMSEEDRTLFRRSPPDFDTLELLLHATEALVKSVPFTRLTELVADGRASRMERGLALPSLFPAKFLRGALITAERSLTNRSIR
ncbi:hypothetical protein [Pseudooceanicola sp. LIPI14-2-Ac024]|uniref:hypothetical protein n=1 Tax=Pseudooceanicola sp. LIPI14-2-Ac024 TaxID=3344875 RepID=UPI0035CEE107